MATILTIGHNSFEVTPDVAAGMIKLLDSGQMTPVMRQNWCGEEWVPTDPPKIELLMGQKVIQPAPPPEPEKPANLEHIIDAEVAP